MQAAPTDRRYPKLRPLDIKPVLHQGNRFIMLRDPLQVSDKLLLIPQPLAIALALCDGTRENASALSAAVAVRAGFRIDETALDELLAALDDALMLENDRFAEAREKALAQYREAPFRPAALAGLSYPAEPDELKQLLNRYLDGVDKSNNQSGAGLGRGLVSPHIDYNRGGPVYAEVWWRARDIIHNADLIVVFGTDHYGGEMELTLTRQHYSTPYGVLPTARDVVEAIATEMGEDAAFRGELRHRGEHSVELAAVWLHHMREGKPVEMVPVLCGSFARCIRGEAHPSDDPGVNRLLRTLSEATSGRRVAVVAAADLSHVGPAFGGPPLDLAERARVKEADDDLIDRICAGDADGFLESVRRVEDRNNVCGVSAIYLALRLLAGSRGERVAYSRCPADEEGTSLVSICGVVL